MRYLWGALLIILGESVSLFVFAALRRTQDPNSISAANSKRSRLDSGEDVGQGSPDGQEHEQMIDKKKPDDDGRSTWAVGKGMLERLTMVVGLLGGFPHILTVIGALKIGTRLQDEKTDHISNTYFLTGNLVSILLAITYAIILRWLWS